jgi:hypothetical protein
MNGVLKLKCVATEGGLTHTAPLLFFSPCEDYCCRKTGMSKGAALESRTRAALWINHQNPWLNFHVRTLHGKS